MQLYSLTDTKSYIIITQKNMLKQKQFFLMTTCVTQEPNEAFIIRGG